MIKKMGQALLTFGIVLMFASPLSSAAQSADITPFDCNGQGSCIPIIDRP